MSFSTQFLGKNLLHFKTIDSTQTYLKDLVKKNEAPLGTLVLADYQQQGKGTQGRTWFSLPKPQLMFSVLLKPALSPQRLPLVNILSGILVAKTMEEIGVKARIKWPNDVFIDGKKTAGILSELSTHGNDTQILLGVGINVEAEKEDFPDHLKTSATALSLHCVSPNRFDILEMFLQKLEQVLFSWSQDELIDHTQKEFERLWIYRDKKIEVTQDSRVFRGEARKIDSFGALLLETENQTEKIINGSVTAI